MAPGRFCWATASVPQTQSANTAKGIHDGREEDFMPVNPMKKREGFGNDYRGSTREKQARIGIRLGSAGSGDGDHANGPFAAFRAGERFAAARSEGGAFPAAAVGAHPRRIDGIRAFRVPPADQSIGAKFDRRGREDAKRDPATGTDERIARKQSGRNTDHHSDAGDGRATATADRNAAGRETPALRDVPAIAADEILYFDELSTPGRRLKREAELVKDEIFERMQHDRHRVPDLAAAVFLAVRHEDGKTAGDHLRRFVSALRTVSTERDRHDAPSELAANPAGANYFSDWCDSVRP